MRSSLIPNRFFIMSDVGGFPDIASQFSASVARHRHATALVCSEENLTYDELDFRSSMLAQEFSRRLRPENRRLGICMRRGKSLVLATLAAVKAGATYVPLDPSLPVERLRAISEDADLGATAVHLNMPACLRSVLRHPIVVEPFSGTNSRVPSLPGPSCVPHHNAVQDCACIMYTSGTTGKPKGVMIPNRGITRLVAPQRYLSIQPNDRILHYSNFSFDASTFEIWAPLLNGASLVLYPHCGFDLELFSRTLRSQGITLVLVTTGLLHLIAEQMPECLSNVRVVLTGGEVLYANPVKKIWVFWKSCG